MDESERVSLWRDPLEYCGEGDSTDIPEIRLAVSYVRRSCKTNDSDVCGISGFDRRHLTYREYVKPSFVKMWYDVGEILWRPLWESRFVVWQLANTRPVFFVRCAENSA